MSPFGFVAVFSGFVLWLLQVALFGGMVCSMGATALAVAPGFRSDRKGFANRFLFFLWRYGLPAWAMMELAVCNICNASRGWYQQRMATA